MKARIGDIDIHYTIEGQGPWVTMSHSLACDISMWDAQAVTVDNRLGADTIAGRTHLFISPYASAIQWVKDGKAKAIAVTSTPDQMDKLISLEVLNFKKLAAAAQIQID